MPVFAPYRPSYPNPEPYTVTTACPAFTKFLPTMDPEVPRWCVTFKEGRSNGRHGGYGRVHYAGVVSTVSVSIQPCREAVR